MRSCLTSLSQSPLPDPSVPAPRNTAVRDAHRRAIARDKPPCGICGDEIDYRLRYPDLDSYVVDHIHPRAKGGSDDLDNKQAAHNRCNRAKSDKLAGHEHRGTAGVAFVTARQW